MKTDCYKGKKVSVIGFGRSGKACAELLVKMGAKVFVSEINEYCCAGQGTRTYPNSQQNIEEDSSSRGSFLGIKGGGVPKKLPLIEVMRTINRFNYPSTAIWNEPNLVNSDVIYVRDLGSEKNQLLKALYPGRKSYVFEYFLTPDAYQIIEY